MEQNAAPDDRKTAWPSELPPGTPSPSSASRGPRDYGLKTGPTYPSSTPHAVSWFITRRVCRPAYALRARPSSSRIQTLTLHIDSGPTRRGEAGLSVAHLLALRILYLADKKASLDNIGILNGRDDAGEEPEPIELPIEYGVPGILMDHHLSPAMRSGAADVGAGLNNANCLLVGNQETSGSRGTILLVVVVRGLKICVVTIGLLERLLHRRNRRTASPTGFRRLGF